MSELWGKMLMIENVALNLLRAENLTVGIGLCQAWTVDIAAVMNAAEFD